MVNIPVAAAASDVVSPIYDLRASKRILGDQLVLCGLVRLCQQTDKPVCLSMESAEPLKASKGWVIPIIPLDAFSSEVMSAKRFRCYVNRYIMLVARYAVYEHLWVTYLKLNLHPSAFFVNTLFHLIVIMHASLFKVKKVREEVERRERELEQEQRKQIETEKQQRLDDERRRIEAEKRKREDLERQEQELRKKILQKMKLMEEKREERQREELRRKVASGSTKLKSAVVLKK